MQKTWVEISKKSLIHNLKTFRQIIGPKVNLMSVVKSNAYGHGMVEVAEVAEKHVDWFGVDNVDEALALKKSGIEKPILILGYTINSRLADVVENEFRQTVYNEETLNELGKLSEKFNKKVYLHFKAETGTSRQGIGLDQLLERLEILKKYPDLIFEGLSTHYANIEDTTDHTFAMEQLERFNKFIEMLKEQGIEVPIKHTACSAAAILFPQTFFDMVRVGISQYGMWSSKETYVSANGLKRKIELKPIICWKTIIAQVKELEPGTAVSYGLTEKVSHRTRAAIIPVGYWDGYDRRLSSVGNVLVNGVRCKILGRICMNMSMVDVTDAGEVKSEDEVVLLGAQGGECITAEELAQKIGTINYEAVTRINPVIKRIIV
ncbi:alanine racemase [Patescibacteria group bacterium]|nr:alanine racemase [Patescibacteria group bacterium]MBU1921609.1 alanine racemase [Patescibacteria group bacterium]